jgi:hypothetical protein
METATATATEKIEIVEKVMKWPTNINNKLGCTGFIHIDLPPIKKPKRDDLHKTVFTISTDDGSHPAIKAMLDDIQMLDLQHIGDCLAIASHGVLAHQLLPQLHERIQGRITECNQILEKNEYKIRIMQKKNNLSQEELELQQALEWRDQVMDHRTIMMAHPKVALYLYFAVDNNG